MPEEMSLKDRMSLYEDGKHRRYSLLFSVNGGAFAVAKLLVGADGKANVLGYLTLPELSLGMILFTAIMAADIYAFGSKMRDDFSLEVFNWKGQSVLVSIAVIICAGWFLVAFNPCRC